jgi:two-component system chemotaxis response regulator CheY
MNKILVVDDSKAIRNIIKTALIDDYEIVEAENGEDAFEKANSNGISLFLLDLNMPVMDGISLVRILRKKTEYQKTPIIMLTTEARDEKKQEGKAAGATGWIVKPCNPEKLLSVIKKMLPSC